MRSESLGIKLDKDLQPLWDDIDQKADVELRRVAKEGGSWSDDLETYADAHVALLSKQIHRNARRAAIVAVIVVAVAIALAAFLIFRS